MTALVLVPDAERILSAWLRAQPELVTLVADRVYTELPVDKVWPAVRVRQVGGAGGINGGPGVPFLGQLADVQVDTWGGPKAEAHDVAETCRALIGTRLVGEVGGALIAATAVGALRDQPDTDFSPARPRWLFIATLTVRAARPAAGRAAHPSAQARAQTGGLQ